MTKWLHKYLLTKDPEDAHHFVIRLLKKFGMMKRVLPKKTSYVEILILPQLPKLQFRGRVGLAAGFDKNAEVFPALSHFGFAFLEVGSVTPMPQEGNPRPRIWRVPPQALINQMGFNNCGIVEFKKNIQKYRKWATNVPLFANIGKGRNTLNENAVEDYTVCLESLQGCVDGFVINVSSPNTKDLFRLQTTQFLESVARVLPEGVPTWIKVSPDLTNEELKELCSCIKREPRFAGAVVTNTSRAMAESLGWKAGGLSGTPLFERSLECVGIAKEALGDKIVIGVGGIDSVERAVEMQRAGADLLEIYTSFIYQGPKFVRLLNDKLS